MDELLCASAGRTASSLSEEIARLLAQSRGGDGSAALPPATRRWLGGLAAQLPATFTLHEDAPAREAARRLGVAGFVHRGRIVLGAHPAMGRETVLRHELVHLAQIGLALRGGRVAPMATIEREAEALSRMPVALPARHAAAPARVHPFWPILLAIGAGAYAVLRPSPANAPGPRDTVLPRVPEGQVLGEAFVLFALPPAGFALGGSLRLGLLGSSSLVGATGNMGLRAVQDASRGEASAPVLYLQDAITGAIIGFVVPGGVRLIGQAGVQGLDRLATYGLMRSDLARLRALVELHSRQPFRGSDADAAAIRDFLLQRGLIGRMSQRWFDRRGLILLYRGQGNVTPEILSPYARQHGVEASERLYDFIRRQGVPDREIANLTARHHLRLRDSGYLEGFPPSVLNHPSALNMTSLGIPTTTFPGVAAAPSFGGQNGVIYIIRVPRNAATWVDEGWPWLRYENEHIVFNRVPPGTVIQAIPSNRIPSIYMGTDQFIIGR